MNTVIFIEVFFLGLIWGSFLNMAVFRVKNQLSFSGRSFCDHKKEKLTPKDLIPVLSYIYYRGKCSHCNKKLPLLYPVTELLTGIAFIFVTSYILSQGYSLPQGITNWFILTGFALFFVFFAVYDYLYWEVNVRAIKIALIAATAVAISSGLFPQFVTIVEGWTSLMAGVMAGGIIFSIVKFTKGSGMGEGDIYLMAFAGIFVGLSGLIPLFMVSSITGSIFGIVKAIKIRKLHGVQIQFVPFISFAALTVFFYKDLILQLLNLDNFSVLVNI